MFSTRMIFTRHCLQHHTITHYSTLGSQQKSTQPSPPIEQLLKNVDSQIKLESQSEFSNSQNSQNSTEIPKINPEKPSIFSKINNVLESQRIQLQQQMDKSYQSNTSNRLTLERKNSFDNFLNMDNSIQQRQSIMKEALEHGYFDDAKEIVKKGPKLWEASQSAFPIIDSHALPNIIISNLEGGKKTELANIPMKYSVSLVTFVFSAFGEPHVKSFRDPFLEKFANCQNIGLVQINVEENPFKAPIARMLRPFIKMNVPKEQRNNYYTYYQDISAKRRAIGMTNGVLGWVNLVDSCGRIRWQAHGIATDKEIQSLIDITSSLSQNITT